MNVELSIIIVNWNGIGFLPNCLRSIAQNPPSVAYEVIVVDNASGDGSQDWLSSDDPKDLFADGCFRFIKSEANLGFGRANNLVIEQTNTQLLFLLNPDTLVSPNAIDKLIETLRSDCGFGAVAPKLLNEDGSLQPNVWAFPSGPLSMLVSGLKLYKALPNSIVRDWLYSEHWDYKRRVAVPAFSGAAILVNRQMIDSVGAFDEEFFMYGEDAEWCARMNRKGWKTVFEPDAEVTHLGGRSSVQSWGCAESRLREEDAFIFAQQKCLPKYRLTANVCTRLIVLALYFLYNAARDKDTSELRSIINRQIEFLRSTV